MLICVVLMVFLSKRLQVSVQFNVLTLDLRPYIHGSLLCKLCLSEVNTKQTSLKHNNLSIIGLKLEKNMFIPVKYICIGGRRRIKCTGVFEKLMT